MTSKARKRIATLVLTHDGVAYFELISESNLSSLRGSEKLNCICHCEPCIARRGNPQKKANSTTNSKLESKVFLCS